MCMTNQQIHISRKNKAEAWKHFWPEGNGKAKPDYVLHHINPNWIKDDIERYIQWNVDDVIMMSRADHFKLHDVPGWNKGMKMAPSKYKGMTWKEIYGEDKATEMSARLSLSQSGERNHNFGKPNWNSGKKMPHEMYAARCKKIAQYTLDGELVKVYDSTREAQRQTGFAHNNISFCARGKCKQMNGFVWRFI